MKDAADVRAALARAPASTGLSPVRGDDWLSAGFKSEGKPRQHGYDPRLNNNGAY